MLQSNGDALGQELHRNDIDASLNLTFFDSSRAFQPLGHSEKSTNRAQKRTAIKPIALALRTFTGSSTVRVDSLAFPQPRVPPRLDYPGFFTAAFID